MTAPLVLATRNVGKLRELRPLFAAAGIDVVDLSAVGCGTETDDEAGIECHPTFEENALAKARYFFERSRGRPCVADDSGLEVDALGGAPGIRSRRWSGEAGLEGPALDAANNARLLRELSGRDDRRARFVCAAAYVDGRRELVRRGTVDGSIAREPRGSHGFGYDPYFVADGLGKTLAEATLEEKAQVSHRARAVAAVVASLRNAD